METAKGLREGKSWTGGGHRSGAARRGAGLHLAQCWAVGAAFVGLPVGRAQWALRLVSNRGVSGTLVLRGPPDATPPSETPQRPQKPWRQQVATNSAAHLEA